MVISHSKTFKGEWNILTKLWNYYDIPFKSSWKTDFFDVTAYLIHKVYKKITANPVNEYAPAYKFMQCFHFSLLHNVIHSKIGQNGSGKDQIQRFCGPKTEIPQDLMLLRCWRYSNLKEITLNLVYWVSNLEIIQKSKLQK